MQAYEGALKPGDTRLLLSPTSQFFQYFNNAFGKAAPEAPAKPASPSGTSESPADSAQQPEPGDTGASAVLPERDASSSESVPPASPTP